MSEYATLHVDGWAGRTKQRVEIVARTPRRFRIRAIEPTTLAGRGRVLQPGETALVPVHAIEREEPKP